MKSPRLRRADRYKDPGMLIGIRSICGYTRISPHTFYAWTADHDFPATRAPGGRWCTSKSLIDDWIVGLRTVQRTEKQKGSASEARTQGHE